MLGKRHADGDATVPGNLIPQTPGMSIGTQQNPWAEIWCTTFYAGAQLPFGDNLDDLGSLTDRYRHLYLGSELRLANGTTGAVTFRNNGDSAYDAALWLDTSDNTVLNAITGKQIKLAINATSILGLTATELAGITDNVVALGDLTHRFTELFLSTFATFANGTGSGVRFRNAADGAYAQALWLDTSDNTVLNAITGKVINLAVNSSAIASLSATEFQGVTDAVVALGDASHRFTNLFLSGTIALGGTSILFTTATGASDLIGTSSVDAADSNSLSVSSASAASTSRGGYVNLYGNEHANAGRAEMYSGNGGGASAGYTISGAGVHAWSTNNGTARWSITNAGILQNDGTSGTDLLFNKALSGVADQITTLAGAGSSQSDAAALVSTVTRVTGANGTVGVKLPALSSVNVGRQLTVINSDTTNALKLYSNAAGETIDGQSGTTAISLAAKTITRIIKYDSTNWYASIGAAPF